MATTVDEVVSALSNRLGSPLQAFENMVIARISDRCDLSVTFDPETGTVKISTPMTLVHDGLPTELLSPLLAKNMPNGETGGAFLHRRSPLTDHLELINVLSLKSMNADRIAGMAEQQIRSAMAIEDEVDAALEKLLDERAG
ncbi:MAG: type III secretion system chaperone [Pseudomonadota bacterium]